MEWKEVQVKMQTSVIGLNKKPGFTLIELLIVIVIIGIMSSILLLNTNIVNISNSPRTLEESFSEISQESIIRGKVLGWYANTNEQAIYEIANEETEIISKPIYSYTWNEFTEFEKEIETSDGLKFKLSNDDLDLPYILFYPSGETTGAKFTFYNNNKKYNFVLTHGGEFLRIDEF
jgi:prepilin-type N-terminal cleavage/methylation domain-containing protein